MEHRSVSFDVKQEWAAVTLSRGPQGFGSSVVHGREDHGVTCFIAGTRRMAAGGEPTWAPEVFVYEEAAAHVASALAEQKAREMLKESFAEFFGVDEAEEDCVF